MGNAGQTAPGVAITYGCGSMRILNRYAFVFRKCHRPMVYHRHEHTLC